MTFEPRLPRDDVNVTPRHPVKEAVVLVFGVILVVLVLLGISTIVVDRLVAYVPQSWEAYVFPDFELMRHQPETPEELAQQERLEALLARMKAHWPDHPESLRIGILDAPEPNALAFPGGLILVTSDLLDQVESENELAFVVGHELGHYQGRDHLQSLGRGLALSLVLAAIGQSGSVGDLVALSGQFATRSFSREQESEADAFGLSLVEAEFGHVDGATDFFEKLPSPESDIERSLATYLATHPLNQARIEAIEALARDNGWKTEGDKTPFRR